MKYILLLLCAVSALADVVTLKDGSQISGQIESSSPREIQIRVDDNLQRVAVDRIQSIQFGAGFVQGPPTAAPVALQSVTLPVGTEISVRTIDRIDSKTADTYREYAASLDAPVVVDGVTVLPSQTNAVLKITDIQKAGFRRPASVSLSLVAVNVSGQRVNLETGTLDSKSGSQGRKTARDAAIGGVGGAVLGAVIAGPMGAAAGSTAGALTGAVVGKIVGKVTIPPESRFTYKLTQPVALNYQATPKATPSLPQTQERMPAPEQIPAVPTAALSAVVEPEIVGAVYLQGDDGKLLELERVPAKKRYIVPTFGPLQQTWALRGKTSPVRVKIGQKAQFVVRLANGIDPAFSLFVLETKKGERWGKRDPNEKSAQLTVLFNTKKFGQSSYVLTPVTDFVAGEYAFVSRSLKDFYCFGVGEEATR